VAAFFALPIAAIIQAFLVTSSRQYDIIESDLTQVDTPNDPHDPPHPGVRVRPASPAPLSRVGAGRRHAPQGRT
jgi:hypothetical protein